MMIMVMLIRVMMTMVINYGGEYDGNGDYGDGDNDVYGDDDIGDAVQCRLFKVNKVNKVKIMINMVMLFNTDC